MAFSNYAQSQNAATTNRAMMANYGKNRPTFSSLEELETYGKRPGATGTIPYKGGFLTGSEFRQKQELEKNALTTDYEAKYAEAKGANEARYADILGQYGTTVEGATARGPETLQFDESQFAGLGDQAKKDIAQSYTNLTAANTQNLVSSGLAGTTARGAVTAASARGRTRDTAALNESLRRERVGYSSDIDRFNASTRNAYSQYLDSLTAQKLSFMERREDDYPDQSIYLQQLEKFGNV